jgi:membrane associated rhomboid family serine protease
MFDPNADASPINPIPTIIIILALAVVLPELAFQLGARGFIGGPEAIGWRQSAFERLAFFDTLFEWGLTNRSFPPEFLWRFLSYPFVHISFMNALMSCVMLLALGKFVGERFSSLSVITLFFGATIVGAVAYGVLLDEQAPLFGAFPGIYGLLGAFSWILWMTYDASGQSRMKAFQLIALLLVLQLVFQVIGGGPNHWVADLAGFVAGFAGSFLLAPDGGFRLRRWLQNWRER